MAGIRQLVVTDTEVNVVWSKSSFSAGDKVEHIEVFQNPNMAGMFIIGDTTELQLWRMIGKDMLRVKSLYTPPANVEVRGVTTRGREIFICTRNTSNNNDQVRLIDLNGNQIWSNGVSNFNCSGMTNDGYYLYVFAKSKSSNFRQFVVVDKIVRLVKNKNWGSTTFEDAAFDGLNFWAVRTGSNSISQHDREGNLVRNFSAVGLPSSWNGICFDGKSFFTAKT